MATEVLINDGGAPARILPFTANETIAAGDGVTIDTGNGNFGFPAASGSNIVGVALTAATSGNLVNVVTGRGVILKVNTEGTVTQGEELAVHTNGHFVGKASSDTVVGIALEADGSDDVCKILLY
tara:strand:+ start:141 stop:515 length:375 start_codon:yes stop_codon:yes gene_type:complete